MPTAEIRERTESDLPALAQVLTHVHAHDGYPVEGVDDPLAWLALEQPLGAWVAVLDAQVVAHVALTKPSQTDDAARLLTQQSEVPVEQIAVLGRLYVAPNARRHGLGRKLVKIAMGAAYAANRRAVLDVMTKDKTAITLYETLGWQQLGHIQHHHSDGNTEPALAYATPDPF